MHKERIKEAKQQRKDDKQLLQRREQQLEKLGVTIDDMGQAICRKMRYHMHRLDIKMELPRFFSIKKYKRMDRRNTMQQIRRKIMHRDFAKLLPIAIVSSLIGKNGKTSSGLIGIKTGEWEEKGQQHGSTEEGDEMKTHAPKYCFKQAKA